MQSAHSSGHVPPHVPAHALPFTFSSRRSWSCACSKCLILHASPDVPAPAPAQLALLIKVQARWRGLLGRRTAEVMRREKAATCIQSSYRMHVERAKFTAWRRNKAAVKIQVC